MAMKIIKQRRLATVDLDELESGGRLALCQAVHSLKDSQTADRYIYRRVYGGIYDAVRSQMPWTKHTWNTMARIKDDLAEYLSEHGDHMPDDVLRKLHGDEAVRARSLSQAKNPTPLLDFEPMAYGYTDDPAVPLLSEDRRRLVDMGLWLLDSRSRDVLRAKLDGLTNEEIATLHQLDRQEVANTVGKAVRRMRRWLRSSYGFSLPDSSRLHG